MPSKTPPPHPTGPGQERQPRVRRTYGGRTSRERTEERRERLIFAALRLYGETGFRTTTVRAICQEAGLTERYFYESFSNSEELLCAVCSWSMTRIRQLAREAVARSGEDPAQRFKATTRAYFDYLQAHPGHGRIALFEMEGTSQATSDYLRRELDQTIALVVELHFDPLGPPPPGLEPTLLARALQGATYQLAKEWAQSGFDCPSTALALQIQTLYEALIRDWDQAGR